MRVLIDMNLSPSLIPILAAAGIESIHWSVVGRPSASDAEIMAYAKENGCVVITHDLDFGDILAATQGEGPSVVQVRADDLRPSVIGPMIVAALRQMTNELSAGALVTLDANRLRVRTLPLPSRQGP